MIDFNFEDVDPFDIRKEEMIAWIEKIVAKEGKSLGAISYVFCSDEYLLDMNKTYLQHDYYTDIITFDYTEEDEISGDLFISIDRVKDNGSTLQEGFDREFKRVCIHGVLHLCGYKDKSDAEEQLMRSKEEEAIALY